MRGLTPRRRVGRRRSPGGRRARHRERWRQRHLREAAQGRVRRRHPPPPGGVQPVRASSRAATAWRARRGHELSADYVELNAKLAGLKTAARTSPTTCSRWRTGRSRSSTSGAARATSRASPGRIPGGDFGSMVNSASGDVTGPVWAADLVLAVAGAEHVDLAAARRPTSPGCRRARSC